MKRIRGSRDFVFNCIGGVHNERKEVQILIGKKLPKYLNKVKKSYLWRENRTHERIYVPWFDCFYGR